MGTLIFTLTIFYIFGLIVTSFLVHDGMIIINDKDEQFIICSLIFWPIVWIRNFFVIFKWLIVGFIRVIIGR